MSCRIDIMNDIQFRNSIDEDSFKTLRAATATYSNDKQSHVISANSSTSSGPALLDIFKSGGSALVNAMESKKLDDNKINMEVSKNDGKESVELAKSQSNGTGTDAKKSQSKSDSKKSSKKEKKAKKKEKKEKKVEAKKPVIVKQESTSEESESEEEV